jgi:hypothetical protein
MKVKLSKVQWEQIGKQAGWALGASVTDETGNKIRSISQTNNAERKFRITYEKWTPESTENGEPSESGWINEEGESMEPDEYDEVEDEDNVREDDPNFPYRKMTAVEKAIKFLNKNRGDGGMEFSSTTPTTSGWWTSYKTDYDYRTGVEENRSFHPVNFSIDEIEQIMSKTK